MKCNHQLVWKMQHQYCVNCKKVFGFKDMNKDVVLPINKNPSK